MLGGFVMDDGGCGAVGGQYIVGGFVASVVEPAIGLNEKALNPDSFWLISVGKKSFFFYD